MTSALLFGFDEGFVNPGLVAMRTALDRLPDVPAHLLGVDLSPVSVGRIGSVLAGHDVVVHEVGDRLRGLPEAPGRLSMASWARVFVGSQLPSDVDRVLYLDGDVLVRGSLAPLLATDLDGATVAACPDYWGQHHAWRDPVFRSLTDAPPAAGYFNSGVMVIDLAAWRRDAVERAVLEVVAGNDRALRNLDQDVLNAVLWDRWLPVDWRRWNYPGSRPGWFSGDASIVHFFGPHKPWTGSVPVPRVQEEYEAAAAAVGWELPSRRADRLRAAVRAATPLGLIERSRARRGVGDDPSGATGV